MNNYKLYQIEVVKGYSMRDWRDNLKFALMQAGVEAKITTFLFVDTQIINEQMLEDLNNVLNSGDVPQLYKTEDFEGIYNVGKQECAKKGIASLPFSTSKTCRQIITPRSGPYAM